jgi:hypothetical protein
MPGGISYIGDLTVVESGGEITSQSIGDKALLTTAADATSIEVNSSTGKLGIVSAGSSLSNGVQRAQMSKYAGYWLRDSIGTESGNAGAFSLENTYGSTLFITDVLIEIDTGSSEDAITIDVGFGAADDASYANLIDGLNLKVAGAFSNITDPGSGGGIGLWANGEFINGTNSTTANNLVGFYAIHVVDITG